VSTIVTGGTSGLGLAIATLLHAQGHRIVTVSRRAQGDPRFTHVSGDAARTATVEKAIAAADSAGAIDLLITCAGAGVYGPAGSYDEEDVRRLIDANLTAMILFCDALFPRFARDGGTIVNVLSTAAIQAKANESIYCAAKWGARGYTEVLRAEAKGTRARIISIVPGGMDTPFWPEPRPSFMSPDEIAAVVVDAVQRPVNVTEIVIQR
jgi:NAD(P)-dependent dehydrogenase (short-subunit alcohol dehydrogenase family)